MSLSNAGAIGSQSLAAISSQINVVSRNIAGASTSGYAAKTALLTTNAYGGVNVDGVARATSNALFQKALQATSAQAASAAISDGLDQIDQIFGLSTSTATDSSAGRSPATLIASLSSALQSYSVSPDDLTAAQSVLTAAQSLVGSLNDGANAVQNLRAQADGDIATAVDEINSLLGEFQKVNAEIVAGSQTGRDVSALQDQRDALLNQLSENIGVRTVTRANNDMVLYTDSGATLFETTARSVTFSATAGYSASTVGGSVYVDGVPVTGANAAMPIQSGKLQGLTQLRDVVAPQFQSQLDEVARGLIVAFAEADQGGGGASAPGLFTFAGATDVPSVGLMPGLASEITINANADPTQGGSLDRLRDGGLADPGNPAFTYNETGASGYSDRINELISALSAPQDFDTTAGVGTDRSIADYASSSMGWLEAQRQEASNSASYQETLVTQTSEALSNATGVNLDDQMSRMLDLENAYQASAKLLAAVDAMYKALFQAL
ncbi:flagellar hook-associated protein FlgK [Methylosinus sp. Sm6]|uniref:flagellar hook-associated protein FlgK n=1 Tax=Methylosinus sp. Sm6 TaxID=2866948 RepID=UPI001C99B433|nr:flagellar hook-associated protein FlgK [Methylosinus sp. Sm6]MBY6240584.1 flagellar hook-associated protein FlgK [Methylosinus sp. Sm6]